MLFASNEINYTRALNSFYNRLTPWEKNFKYGSKKKFIDLHLANAHYVNMHFKPSKMAAKLLRDFEKHNITIYVVLNSGVQFNLPHTLDNIVIIPFSFARPSFSLCEKEDKKEVNERKNKIISHELFHIYFRYFDSPSLRSFRSVRSIVKLERNTFVGEITNPDTEDFEGLQVGNKIIFKVLFDSTNNLNNAYFEKYFVAFFSSIWHIRPATLYEKKKYDQQLPFNQNYHSEEMIAEMCC